jgi:hypothetical protein
VANEKNRVNKQGDFNQEKVNRNREEKIQPGIGLPLMNSGGNDHVRELFPVPEGSSLKQNGKTIIRISRAGPGEEENSRYHETRDEDYYNKEWPTVSNPSVMQAGTEEINTNLSKRVANSIPDSLVMALPDVPSKKTDSKKPGMSSRFTLTPFFASDYTAYRLKNGKSNSYDNKAGIEKRERSDLSYAAGALIGYRVGNRITIQSGIIYSSSDITISPTRIYAEKDNAGAIKYRYNTSSGYGYLLPSFSSSPAIGDSLYADGANHTLQYISIPIMIKYKTGNKKFSFNPGVGLRVDFLTGSTLTTDLVDQFNRETESITKIESIKKTGIRLMISPEFQYYFSKNLGMSIMPYFNYSLGPINKGNVVRTYPYTVGFGVGAIYKF